MTVDERTALLEARRSGATMSALASQFGVHIDTVRSELRRQGVAKQSRRFQGEALDELVVLRAAGWRVVDLAQRFTVDPATIYRALRRGSS